jgi:hypothetical protein
MTERALFEILNFGHWDLFVIWGLMFGAYPEPFCSPTCEDRALGFPVIPGTMGTSWVFYLPHSFPDFLSDL